MLSFSVSKNSSWFKDRWHWGQTTSQGSAISEGQASAQSEDSQRELEAAQEQEQHRRLKVELELRRSAITKRSV